MLLVAVTTGAWAQETTTLLEYGTNDVAWTAARLAEWTAGGSPAITDGYVGISGGNGGYATSKTISPASNSIINVTAVWRGRSNTGRAFSAGNGSYFRFGNIIVAQNDQDKKHGYGFAGLSNISGVTTFTAGSYRVDIAGCTWLKIEMEINTANNAVTSFSVKSEDGNTTYASASGIVLTNPDYTTVAFGYHKSGSVSTSNAEQLKSIKVTQTTQPVETAKYTVKYVCNAVEVKDAAVRSGVVDDDIALTAADMENFYANDKKYIYVSNDVEGKKVAKGDGTVVTVTFREAATYAWTAKSSVGTYSISGSVFEGDKASVKYPLYQLVEGKLWTKAATDKVFAQSFDITEDNQQLTLEYSETDIDNVVFYAEVEDIAGMGVVSSGNAEARSSLRAAGYSISGNTLVTTLPQGKYKVNAVFYSPTSAGGKYKFYTGLRELWSETTGNSNATVASQDVVLAKAIDNEILLGQGGSTAAVDLIYIQSLGAPTAEELAAAEEADYNANHISATIPSSGIGTIASAYAIDCANLPSGVKAYKVSNVSANAATLEEVTTAVAPGTGLILRGTAGTYDIPVVAEGTDISGTNELKAAVTATDIEANTAYILQGGQFHLVNAASTVPAGKAYLPVANVSGARTISLSFGEITGVSEVAAEAKAVADGKFIKNGQLVIEKNGKVFNANGAQIK